MDEDSGESDSNVATGRKRKMDTPPWEAPPAKTQATRSPTRSAAPATDNTSSTNPLASTIVAQVRTSLIFTLRVPYSLSINFCCTQERDA